MAPHILPSFVSDRLAFIEIMWQIDHFDAKNFRFFRKAFIIASNFSFDYFVVFTKEAYKLFGIMISNLRMKVVSTTNFYLKGHINKEKIKRGIHGYGPHAFFFREDVIRNFPTFVVVKDRE